MGAEQIDLAGMKVFVAMPTHRPLEPQVVNCLLDTQKFLIEGGLDGGGMRLPTKSAPVCHARASLTQSFLNTDATHLFWIDSDMTWTVDDFFRLCALGKRLGCVGAAGVTKDEARRFCASPLPNGKANKGFEELAIDQYGCAKVGGIGLAFAIMSREIVEKLVAKAGKVRFGPDGEILPNLFQFRETPVADGLVEVIGEDMALFADIRALGYDVWLDAMITLGHLGPHAYSRSFLEGAHHGG